MMAAVTTVKSVKWKVGCCFGKWSEVVVGWKNYAR